MANIKLSHKHHFIYRTTNIINGKYYIGVHNTNDIEDGYLGSGVLLQRAIKKYGIGNFKREIIKHFNTSEEAFNNEISVVNESVVNDDNSYNLSLGGDGSVGLLAKNQISVIDAEGNTFRINSNDSRYKSGELVGVTKGRPQKQVICPHCNTVGPCGPMAQNHFQYCSKNLNRIDKPKMKYKTVTCPYCEKSGREGSMRRFHFNFCKKNPNRKELQTKPLKTLTCPHCGKAGKGGAMKTRHFDNCKENPNRLPAKKITHKQQTCPHCGKVGKGGAMKQWHFDNCNKHPKSFYEKHQH